MCGAFSDRAIETPDVPTPEQQLCDYVVFRTNNGDDVATILAGALVVFGEEPPAETSKHVEPGHRYALSVSDAEAIRDALLDLKRRRGGYELGLA